MYAWLAVVLLAVLACVIVMVALFVAAWRRTLAQVEASGLRYRMRCESCGHEFELSPREFARSGMRRSRSTTRTRVKGVALVNEPHYHYVAKRFVCPACAEKTWCENLNANEARDVVNPIALRNFGAALVVLVLIGFALRAVLA
ncbi:hypothetical protein [Olsenella sp. An270]|uniref:hypothetical protein n=1 Tax=Olsenella sp. An270 TaxID=1965615 RepID=UPI00117E63BE|nr:hypothetical protein [Olsenella sp. An270]